jgi:hypothetical protein
MYRFIMLIPHYNNMVKPVYILSTIQSIYLGGYINGLDDLRHLRKKPVYVNVLQICKYATAGAVLGFTFPISVPIAFAYLAYLP